MKVKTLRYNLFSTLIDKINWEAVSVAVGLGTLWGSIIYGMLILCQL